VLAPDHHQDGTPASLGASALGGRLLTWTAANLPDYPWREGGDPYAVWVAVIMLQQTRVATVLPYFDRFLSRFPSPADLANANLGDVLKAWEGLGYYARARNLHAAARSITDRYDGSLPSDHTLLLGLPGVGEYTAAAVLSIAFQADVPALDGNVRRVICRLYAIEDDPGRTATQGRLAWLASQLLPKGQAGDFNQGLMQFGADVCAARNPRCGTCPVQDLCLANLGNRVGDIPVRRIRQTVPHITVAAGVIRDGAGNILVSQRDVDDMLGGLWEFPGGQCETNETLRDCIRREVEEELGILVDVQQHLVTIQHAYSHFRITLHAYNCQSEGQPRALGVADWRWVAPRDLQTLPFSATGLRIIESILQPDTEPRPIQLDET